MSICSRAMIRGIPVNVNEEDKTMHTIEFWFLRIMRIMVKYGVL